MIADNPAEDQPGVPDEISGRGATVRVAATQHGGTRALRQIAFWLYGVCALIFLIILVGGATRLTDSGLSITEWRPVSGILPPFSADAWDVEFSKYKQIPEFRLVNFDMDLAAFKVIYWWEWGHRALGRVIGLAFFAPFAWFWWRGMLTTRLKLLLSAALALGALQGAVGWWMVSSGLTQRTDVAPLRLAIHLSLACAILAYLYAIARPLGDGRTPARPLRTPQNIVAVGVLLLVFAQIFLGALVAGGDAGLSFNTWPLMDGQLIPGNLLTMDPAWHNFFENPKTTQFQHRIGAYLLLAAVAGLYLHCRHAGRRMRPGGEQRLRAARNLLVAVLLQAVCGVALLLLSVPIPLALIHQLLGAITVLLAAELVVASAPANNASAKAARQPQIAASA